jgi:hypothetical protein
MRYRQIYDHEWFRPGRRLWVSCCDCALIHVQELRLTGRFIEMRLTRDDRATAAARRGKGLPMTKVREPKKAAVTPADTAAALASLVRLSEEDGKRDHPSVAAARSVVERLKSD